jgi:hypothetical protein
MTRSIFETRRLCSNRLEGTVISTSTGSPGVTLLCAEAYHEMGNAAQAAADDEAVYASPAVSTVAEGHHPL